MATGVWLKGGQVAMTAAGNVWACDHCPCGILLCGCDQAGLPSTLHLTTTDPGTNGCPCVIGNFVLNSQLAGGVGGNWRSDPFACHGGSAATWAVICNAQGKWQLSLFCQGGRDIIVVAAWSDSCTPFTESGSFAGDPFGNFTPGCCPPSSGPVPLAFNWLIS